MLGKAVISPKILLWGGEYPSRSPARGSAVPSLALAVTREP